MKNLLMELKLIIYSIRIQHCKSAMTGLSKMLTNLTSEYKDIMERLFRLHGKEVVMTEIARINDALDKGDLVLTADLLEGVCIPAIEPLIEEPEPVKEGGYAIEGTSSGWLTAKSEISDGYLHSNIDPMWEAEQLIRSIYDPKKNEYLIWGLGLGYPALKLSEYTDGSVPIRVYEEDKELIRLADIYGVGSILKERNVEIIYDVSAKGFVKGLGASKDSGLLMLQPCIKKIKSEELKEVLIKFYNEYESIESYRLMLSRNYFRNEANITHNVDEIADKIKDSEVVIVAAGPSLDENLQFLKASKGSRVIFCVGTVLKKLINSGILPDYVFFLDAQSRNMHQIEGVENCGVKAVFGATSYWRIPAEYKGEKFIAYQSSYNENRANKDNAEVSLYDSGGTVTSLALDVALKQDAQSIYLVGVDMAYKDGYSHASGTHDRHMTEKDELIKIKGNSGDMVYTTRTLNKFRLWIENELAEYPDIPVYNLSKTGAYIKGTHLINETLHATEFESKSRD